MNRAAVAVVAANFMIRLVWMVALLVPLVGFSGVADAGPTTAGECAVNDNDPNSNTKYVRFNQLVPSVQPILEAQASNCVDYMITDIIDPTHSSFSPFTLTLYEGSADNPVMSDRLVFFYDRMQMPNVCGVSLENDNGGAGAGTCDIMGVNTDTFLAGDPAVETLMSGNLTNPNTGKVWNVQLISQTGLTSDTIQFNAVPEPATLGLFGAGLAGLGALRRRRKAKV